MWKRFSLLLIAVMIVGCGDSEPHFLGGPVTIRQEVPPEIRNRGFLAVGFAPDEENVSGAIVGVVLPAGPADQAGVEVGDIVREIDGKVVTSESVTSDLLASSKPGQLVSLAIQRGEEQVVVEVTLASFDEVDQLARREAVTDEGEQAP